mgnify:CR=1 FL=1
MIMKASIKKLFIALALICSGTSVSAAPNVVSHDCGVVKMYRHALGGILISMYEAGLPVGQYQEESGLDVKQLSGFFVAIKRNVRYLSDVGTTYAKLNAPGFANTIKGIGKTIEPIASMGEGYGNINYWTDLSRIAGRILLTATDQLSLLLHTHCGSDYVTGLTFGMD